MHESDEPTGRSASARFATEPRSLLGEWLGDCVLDLECSESSWSAVVLDIYFDRGCVDAVLVTLVERYHHIVTQGDYMTIIVLFSGYS